jgi:hypothetical protein
MAVLVTAIHVLPGGKDVDARDKPAHDGVLAIERNLLQSLKTAKGTVALAIEMSLLARSVSAGTHRLELGVDRLCHQPAGQGGR